MGVSEVDIKNFTTEERFNYVSNNRSSYAVLDYLSNKFINLRICMYDKYEGSIMELMNKDLLRGWCFQTTEIASLFLDDDSYIIRGVLKLNRNKKYYHSWIVFSYNNKDYVFDPCLNFVTTRDFYDKVFDVEIRGKVSSGSVKECFVDYVTNSIKKSRFKENVSEPMYRNTGIKYRMELENGKVKKLKAYYLNK